MKNDLPYFSHNNNARRHPKMKALIAEFGFEGYGRFWALCERIAEDSDAYLDISKKVNKLDLAGELGLDGNGLDTFLSFLADPEIDLINLEDNIITIDMVNRYIHSHRGEKHWNWKGGITPENQTERSSKRYKKWVEAIFVRDNYTCRSCNKRGRRLNAHHIKAFAKHPELRLEITNGITLCVDCHRALHRRCRRESYG